MSQRAVAGVPISLHKEYAESSGIWDCIASGQTNKDGRIGDLLPPANTVMPGVYKYVHADCTTQPAYASSDRSLVLATWSAASQASFYHDVDVCNSHWTCT